MIRSVARRFGLPFVGIAAAIAAIGLLGAAFSDAGVGRSVSLAFYLSGSLATILGAVAGMQGPLRRDRDHGGRRRGVRVASGEERGEARVVSVLLVLGGLAFLLIGLVVDPRVRVV